MVIRKVSNFGSGEGLEPVSPLDLNDVNSFDELLTAMSKTAFGGRNLGEAANVLTEMVEDNDLLESKSVAVLMPEEEYRY